MPKKERKLEITQNHKQLILKISFPKNSHIEDLKQPDIVKQKMSSVRMDQRYKLEIWSLWNHSGNLLPHPWAASCRPNSVRIALAYSILWRLRGISPSVRRPKIDRSRHLRENKYCKVSNPEEIFCNIGIRIRQERYQMHNIHRSQSPCVHHRNWCQRRHPRVWLRALLPHQQLRQSWQTCHKCKQMKFQLSENLRKSSK